MFRPERMTSASIICVKQDVETVLEALSSFGEFQIEKNAEENATSSEYGQLISKAEESLSSINDLIRQLSQKKAGLLDAFKVIQPIKMQVTTDNWQALSESTSQQVSALKREVDGFNASLHNIQGKITQLNHIKDMLTTMEKMRVDLGALQNLKLIHVVVASLPHKIFDKLKTSLVQFPLFLNRGFLTKETDFVSIAVPSKLSEDINKILKSHNAEIFAVPKDLPHNLTDALNEVNNQLNDNTDKEKAVLDSLKTLSKENNNKLASWKETTENVLLLLNAKRKILKSGRLAAVSGFVPRKEFSALNEKVHAIAGEGAIVLKNELAESQDPPSKIRNNRFVKPFEIITKLYGLPHYNELDPTPLMAITFPILFGLMFGDAGHGLVLLVGGLAVGLLLKNNQVIKNIGWIIAACGIAAIVAGLMYGEFFGQELIPLWFNPFHSSTAVFDLLVFSLIVGVIQITSGLVLEMADFLVKRNVADAFLVSLPKIIFYIGAVYVIIVYNLNLAAWFAGPILIIIVPFIIMVVAKPAFSTLSHSFRSGKTQGKKEVKEKEGESFGERLSESGDLVTRLLSNTISYSRILALLMAHWALLIAVDTVALLVGPVLGTVIFIFGNLLVIALEGIIVFIHTLRLHFYEWFSRFYQDGGTEFKPFKQNFVYTDLTIKKKSI